MTVYLRGDYNGIAEPLRRSDSSRPIHLSRSGHAAEVDAWSCWVSNLTGDRISLRHHGCVVVDNRELPGKYSRQRNRAVCLDNRADIEGLDRCKVCIRQCVV